MNHYVCVCVCLTQHTCVLLHTFACVSAYYLVCYWMCLRVWLFCVTRPEGALKRLLEPTCAEPEQTWNIHNAAHTRTHKAKTCQGRWCDILKAQSSSLSIRYREHFVKGMMGNILLPERGWVTAPPCGAFSFPYAWTCGYWSVTSDKHGQMDSSLDQNRAWGGEMGVCLCFKCIKYWIFIIHESKILGCPNGWMKKYTTIDFTFSLQNGFPMLTKYNVNRRGCLGCKAENQVDHHPKSHTKLPTVMHSLSRSAFRSFDTLFTHSSPLSRLSTLYKPSNSSDQTNLLSARHSPQKKPKQICISK